MSRPSWKNPLGFLLFPCVPCSSSIPLVSSLSVFSSLPLLYPTAPSFPSPPAITLHPSLFISLSLSPYSSPHIPVIFGPTPGFPSIYPPIPPSVLHLLSAFLSLTHTYINVLFFSSLLSEHLSLHSPGRGMDRGMDGWMDG